MPGEFPHLRLSYRGTFDPKFDGGIPQNDAVDANRNDPKGHASTLRHGLDGIRKHDAQIRQLRLQLGLPAIPAARDFLLKLPEGADIDYLVRALGVELVAETEAGFVLVSSSDLEFAKLEEVLRQFENGEGSLVAASSLLEIYESPDDDRRLRNILTPEVFDLWPFEDTRVYVLDLGIQTAMSTRDVQWPKIRKRNDESEEQFLNRKKDARQAAITAAYMEWDDHSDSRVKELRNFTDHYGGNLVSGPVYDDAREAEAGMIFPDSIQVRIEMSGSGFRDVVLNFPHLFEVALPPVVQEAAATVAEPVAPPSFVLLSPEQDAAAVCVIDSGIEEEHKWLEAAIDAPTSRCFLPNVPPEDTADYVNPQGHGTRVAGAVLYPGTIPTTGQGQAVAWIQNARVLDSDAKLPDNLPPEKYLYQVVTHFHREPYATKIYNHSINANSPCPRARMTSWAAKIDQLSHEFDVLFIQSVGNQNRNRGDIANPGLCDHLDAGREPPQHHLQASMRVANPGQSLHALTVGSISDVVFDEADDRSFATEQHHPSGFSRAGYGEPWSVVKPEVVELGGDLLYSKTPPYIVRPHTDVSVELLNSTMHGQPAFSKDGTGTSFAAPKVAHIAAHLKNLFPEASPLLYRALIVQSARWPVWAENEQDTDKVLRLIGYGIPSLERASTNSESRITLIMPQAELLPSKKLHLYTVPIPAELRNAALEARIRIDVTLAYTALPRRTRARRTGYLETWLDWEASKLGESRERFIARMEQGGTSAHRELPWILHKGKTWGQAEGTCRNQGTVQKDWAVFDSYELPEDFSIAVRGHKGWNHLDGAGTARYCLVVSFEVLQGEVPIYAMIENEIRAEAEVEALG